MKVARTVRGGAVRKGLSGDTTCGDTWRVGLWNYQHLACRLLYHKQALQTGMVMEVV